MRRKVSKKRLWALLSMVILCLKLVGCQDSELNAEKQPIRMEEAINDDVKAGMNPKTLQYLMGHSEIGVTLNTYTHLGLEDAAEELKRMEDLEKARKEIFGEEKEKTVKQNMFRVV